MSVSRKFFRMACSVGLTLALSGCASEDTSSGETGSIGLNLELATDVVINEVDYLISGNGITPVSGTIDTSAPGATASVEVFGLPPGQGYLVELSATSEDGETSCGGSAPFDVTIGVSTDVMVMLSCKRAPRYGGVRVNGKLNICADLMQAVVSPLQTSVGNDIDLSAIANDEEGDAIQYAWSGTGGNIADPNAASTTYTCSEAGEQSITIVISDDDFENCMDEWTVPVTCVVVVDFDSAATGNIHIDIPLPDDPNVLIPVDVPLTGGAIGVWNASGAGAFQVDLTFDDSAFTIAVPDLTVVVGFSAEQVGAANGLFDPATGDGGFSTDLALTVLSIDALGGPVPQPCVVTLALDLTGQINLTTGLLEVSQDVFTVTPPAAEDCGGLGAIIGALLGGPLNSASLSFEVGTL
jgi:hypothetical protein